MLLKGNSRLDSVKKVLPSLINRFPENDKFTVIYAAVQLCENKLKRCENLLTRYFIKHNSNDDRIATAIARLKLRQGRYSDAIEFILKLEESIWAKPDILLILIAAQQRINDIDGAIKSFNCATSYWSSKKEGEFGRQNLRKTLMFSASFYMGLKRWEEATKQYLQILKVFDDQDREALVGLVRSAVRHDLKLAKKYSNSLSSFLPTSMRLIDAEELEHADIPASNWGKKSQQIQSSSAGIDGQKTIQKKKKRKKKPRYPKGFDPENPGPPPNPERWLPKRERSAFKKLYRKKDRIAHGPQGAMPTSDSGPSKSNAPSTAHAEAAQEVARPKPGGRRKVKR